MGNGSRVFVEFGPKSTLNKLVKDILPEKNVFVFSVNPLKIENSDKYLRFLGSQLCVMGSNMQNFDPWQVENPFEIKTPESKQTLTLSATTYISKKKIKELNSVMND